MARQDRHGRSRGAAGRRLVLLGLAALSVLLFAASVTAAFDISAGHALAPPARTRAPRGSQPAAAPLAHRPNLTEFPAQGPCGQIFCWTPGEPVLAVGPSDVLETVNTEATVYTKSGTKLAEYDFANWWGPKEISCGDPRALYIASIERFAFSCTGFGTGPMRFAISKTSNPAGEWLKYEAPNGESLDQDKIAASSNKFIIAGNGSSEENSEWIYVYNLSELAAGVSKPSVVKVMTANSNLYVPAVEQTATSDIYLVASFPGEPLWLATITGTPAEGNVAIKETEVPSSDFPAPGEPHVPGGQIGGGALDGRIYDAIYETETSDGKPVIAYSSARECATRTCISAGKIDLSGSKPALSSYTLIGEPGWDYTYGGVGMNSEGTIFDVYSRSNASNAPGVGVLGPGYDVTLQSASKGVTSCEEGEPEPCNERWGDYLGTAIDPSEPSSVWVSGLYQNTTGRFGWGTIIAKVSPNAFALPTVSTGKASKETASGAKVAAMVNPNGVSTEWHIDYGTTTGYEATTPEQSAGAGTKAVAVSATIAGLSPGTTYHYRVVASTTTGNADGADATFNTKGPKIKSVTFSGTPSNPTVTIKGSSLGSMPAAEPSEPLNCFPEDKSFDYGSSLYFSDGTQGWAAGQIGDCVGLIVHSYSEKRIVYSFGAGYSHYGQITKGDSYSLTVYSLSHSGTVAYR